MKLEYQPHPPPTERPWKRRARKIAAMTLLCIGLFFGLAETAVSVLALLAAGPFSDMRHQPPPERLREILPVVVMALGGYAVAAVGYVIDPAKQSRTTEDEQLP